MGQANYIAIVIAIDVANANADADAYANYIVTENTDTTPGQFPDCVNSKADVVGDKKAQIIHSNPMMSYLVGGDVITAGRGKRR